jgi:hypothetical protein
MAGEGSVGGGESRRGERVFARVKGVGEVVGKHLSYVLLFQ